MTGNIRTVGGKVHSYNGSCIYRLNENSIEFSLSTRTWSGFKSSWLKSYIYLSKSVSDISIASELKSTTFSKYFRPTTDLEYCYDLAEWLSHYLYLLYFTFLLDLLHREEYGKVSHHKCHSHIITNGHLLFVMDTLIL